MASSQRTPRRFSDRIVRRVRRFLSLMGLQNVSIKLIAIVLIFLACIAAAVAAYGINRFQNKSKNETRAKLWNEFSQAAAQNNEKEMKQVLDQLIATDPSDKLAKSRREALDSGSADEDDKEMPALTMMMHFTKNQWPEAEREANKLLKHRSNDWNAYCVVAAAALSRKDLPAANDALDKMIAIKQDNFNPAGFLLAVELFSRTNRDLTPLRDISRRVISIVIQHPKMSTQKVPMRIAVLRCYLLAFEYNPKPGQGQPEGLLHVAPRSVEMCIDSIKKSIEENDEPSMYGLADVVIELKYALRFLYSGPDGNQTYQNLCKELDTNCETVWEKLFENDPNSIRAHRGRVKILLQNNKLTEAFELIQKGLQIHPDDPILLDFFSKLVIRYTNKADDVLPKLIETAKKDPNNIQLWIIAFEHALSVKEYEVAGQAIDAALALKPQDIRLIFSKCKYLILTEDPLAALQLMDQLKDNLAFNSPVFLRMYTRACIDANSSIRLENCTKHIENLNREKSYIPLLEASLSGIVDAKRFDPETLQRVIKQTQITLMAYPENSVLPRLQAMAYYRIAEESPNRWDSTVVGNAIRMFSVVRARNPNDLDAITRIVWLQLKGRKENQLAYQEAQPLIRIADRDEPLSGYQLYVLACACLGEIKTQEKNERVRTELAQKAVKHLEKAMELRYKNASVMANLSLAYFHIGDRAKSIEWIGKASKEKKSSQEQADYMEIVTQLPQ